jgi:hypothetical protein
VGRSWRPTTGEQEGLRQAEAGQAQVEGPERRVEAVVVVVAVNPGKANLFSSLYHRYLLLPRCSLEIWVDHWVK